mmetsp:Transcript_12267/g.36868  ORF Transcript_12267/g.36868 Transcript_12267/m.36868 type:complete len:232 (+) Transcript_12267:860-1555(+)
MTMVRGPRMPVRRAAAERSLQRATERFMRREAQEHLMPSPVGGIPSYQKCQRASTWKRRACWKLRCWAYHTPAEWISLEAPPMGASLVAGRQASRTGSRYPQAFAPSGSSGRSRMTPIRSRYERTGKERSWRKPSRQRRWPRRAQRPKPKPGRRRTGGSPWSITRSSWPPRRRRSPQSPPWAPRTRLPCSSSFLTVSQVNASAESVPLRGCCGARGGGPDCSVPAWQLPAC